MTANAIAIDAAGGTKNAFKGSEGTNLSLTGLAQKDGNKGQVSVSTKGAIVTQGTLSLGNATIDTNGSPIDVATLTKATGYGDSTILVTNEEAGSVRIGSVEKDFINIVDKDGALTAKYGTPAAARARMEETILAGDIQKNYKTISGEASDMTGAWTYDPATGKTAWEFGESDSPTLAAAKHFDAANLAQWRFEVNHISDRLGDVRNQRGTLGTWARVYGAEAKVDDSVSSDIRFNSIQAGADTALGDNWILGTALAYTNTDASFNNGEADADSFTFSVYGSAFFLCGGYLDVIGRVGRINSDIEVLTVTPFDASYDNTTYGLSAEVGYRWDLTDTFYAIPQAELSYGFVKGDGYTASNDIHIEQDDFQTLIGRLGVQLGANFPEDRGSVYATFSYNYDFKGDTDATATRYGATPQNVHEELGGGWFSYGVGAQFNVTDATSFYGSLTRANGSVYTENYHYSVGVRHVW